MSKEELLNLYSNQQLTDYLRGLNAVEIGDCHAALTGPNDVTHDEAIIIDALINEMAYRESNPLLATRNLTKAASTDVERLSNYNQIARMVSQDEAEFSENYFALLGIDTTSLYDQCPMMLSVDKFSRLYGLLTQAGWSDEQVEKMLVSDSEVSKYSYDLLLSTTKRGHSIKSTLTDDSFKKFVKTVYKNLSSKTTTIKSSSK